MLLQYVIAKIDSASNATEVTSSINVLVAIQWVALAWKEVKESTIIKCFKTAGILNDTFDIQERICTSEDPFEDIDETISLTPLISAAMGTIDACSTSEYINGDNELPVCADLDDDYWEDNFMESLTQQEATPAAEDSDPEDDVDVPSPVPKIEDFKEAVQTLEDVQNFFGESQLSRNGYENKYTDQQSCSLPSLHNAANNTYTLFPQKQRHCMKVIPIMMFCMCHFECIIIIQLI